MGFALVNAAGSYVCGDDMGGGAGAEMIRTLAAAPTGTSVSLTYPHQAGKLSFPKDEGRHSLRDLPATLAEWYALYAHLAAEDGGRYLLFTTFVTFDPVEPLLHDRFPHVISTLVDVTDNASYHHSSMTKLKRFSEGHVDTETTKGDYFRWNGAAKPFEYDFHVAWSDAGVDYSANLNLKMIKPPLLLNGTGYVRLPSVDSGYYSQTRVKATGQLRINGADKKVSGILWVDRQWLGVPFADGSHYTYDWWGLQLDNDEEAILFRIWDTRTKTVAAARLEINRADGTRDHVTEFTLADTSSGWSVRADKPGWDLSIVRACQGHKPGECAPVTFLDARWYSCNVTGTIGGKRVGGVAVAELVPKPPPALSPAGLLRSLAPPPAAKQ